MTRLTFFSNPGMSRCEFRDLCTIKQFQATECGLWVWEFEVLKQRIGSAGGHVQWHGRMAFAIFSADCRGEPPEFGSWSSSGNGMVLFKTKDMKSEGRLETQFT
jgi:hypothetical protein